MLTGAIRSTSRIIRPRAPPSIAGGAARIGGIPGPTAATAADLAASGDLAGATLAPLGLSRLVTRPATIGFGKTYPAFWINLRAGMAKVWIVLKAEAAVVGRIAKEDERDLEQARVGIEAVRALTELIDGEVQGQIRGALSELQMLYAKAAKGEPLEGGGEAGEAPPPEQPPPQKPQSKLWTPGPD